MDGGDWIALAGVVVTACFGATTVVFARRAQRAQAVAERQAENARNAARDSAEAAQRSADAQRAIEKSQANLVLIEPDHDMRGTPGFVLRNNSQASIFKVEVKPSSDDANLWGWDARDLPERIGRTLVADTLKPGEATRAWVPTRNQEKVAIDHVCVTFDDASGKSWRRAGNGPPVNN